MRKSFEFRSSIRGVDHKVCSVEKNYEIHILITIQLQHRTASSPSAATDTRRRLFRQHKSCPHFSLRIDKNLCEESSQGSLCSLRYYLKIRPKVLDIGELLERVAKFVGNEFIYLNYAVDEDNEFFSTYGFREVPYSSVDRAKYFTISRHGFSMWSRKECVFTPLEQWAEEHRKYCLVSQVVTFYFRCFVFHVLMW